MINANKEVLNSFFSSNLQYIVPFFQRAYIWDEENWEVLWDHIQRTAAAIANGNVQREHFIGTLITKQREALVLGENRRDLIDGQQRLTTFAVLLKAIADSVSGDAGFELLPDLINQLVSFQDAAGKKHHRIEHSKNDRDYFNAVMNGDELDSLPNQEHRILRCYRYFRKNLQGLPDSSLNDTKTILLNNVPVIHMLLSANDDEQEIFDTINSLGVRLTTGELLKNFIFSDPEIRPYYSTHWEPVFEEDEDQIAFWNTPKTSGRVIRTNVEVLLYCYLIIQKKATVELERLFKEYKSWLSGKSLEDRISVLQEIKDLAEIYFSFPDSTDLNQIKFSQETERFFHVIENFEITTIYPLVLFIFSRVSNAAEQLATLKILESYLVRRQVCKLSTKNYNNVFVQLIRNLDDAGEISAQTLENLLNEYSEDGNRKPTDAEFVAAFSTQALSNKNAGEVLFCIALYQISSTMNDIQSLSSSSYSVEHMMPQKWETHWAVPGMDDVAVFERTRKIKTLGNLTLVTHPLNSSMKNGPWENKRQALQTYSSLKLTTDYLQKDEWTEADIDSRAADLAQAALAIWS